MNTSKNIWLVALGGAVIAGLIAAFWTKETREPFPLSPTNDLSQLPKTDPELTTSDPGTSPEMKEVLQQS
jgi:hypothetical protein